MTWVHREQLPEDPEPLGAMIKTCCFPRDRAHRACQSSPQHYWGWLLPAPQGGRPQGTKEPAPGRRGAALKFTLTVPDHFLSSLPHLENRDRFSGKAFAPKALLSPVLLFLSGVSLPKVMRRAFLFQTGGTTKAPRKCKSGCL